jgi:hypothetical protein
METEVSLPRLKHHAAGPYSDLIHFISSNPISKYIIIIFVSKVDMFLPPVLSAETMTSSARIIYRSQILYRAYFLGIVIFLVLSLCFQ